MLLPTPLSTPPAPSSCDPEEPPAPEDTAQSRVLLPLTGHASPDADERRPCPSSSGSLGQLRRLQRA
ncbi:unnamed protein product, partial [Rangifer tarandus platyrhynchus]